ncbi:MAG: type I restriction-modification system endonuclease [Deltaproteobacteria bacterium]|nr:type I restriction-modification system endonuclease [Deltaproteobacteria bacterium]MCB9787982.1 type I restriction-modification system endonuclease [Deltaproteobacteria bacterium]
MAEPSPPDTAGPASPNFGHLSEVVPLLASHGVRAERYVFEDPVAALFRLRQFGEILAQQVAASTGLYTSPQESQTDLLRRLKDARIIDFEVADLFHALRKAGNVAVHDNRGTQRDALHGLRIAWRLGVWFQRGFNDPKFKSGPFVPPPDPREAEYALEEELAQLRATLADHEAQVVHLQATAEEEAQRSARAKAEAEAAYEDLAVALELAEETEAKAARLEEEFQAKLALLQAEVAAAPKPAVDAVILQARHATDHLHLDESETRLLVDAQLREAGWEADTVAISHKAGVRPTKGRNLAIAEWPTSSGPADYVLFAGLVPLAVVEAKRKAKDVVGAIEQSKRYSRAYRSAGNPLADGAPWGDYCVPFLFATNARPFLRQLKTRSGIWFLDARRPTNHPRPLEGWYTPQGLLDLLKQDTAKADARLQSEPSDYLPLRDYQHAAIAAVEDAVAAGQQDMLLAMATGTGKTRLALCLIYRLIKAGRFRRVLFLVDRTALGEQAHNAFKDVRLEHLQTFTEIYDVKGLGDMRPEPDTRLHVATVQGMVRRLMYAPDDAEAVPVDWYDCVIVDECHRGYALDQEMSDAQVEYRSEADYISKYRRVLDHFDAVRIGLTATPALHTTEIFGPPIFEYGYRQAVIDGYLVDHEPPIRIRTRLNEDGIHWKVGEEVAAYDTGTGQIDLFNAPDEIDIEVEGFNVQVLTENFNKVVCEALAKEIDPSLPGKAMIFCATDAHADLVVNLLKAAFTEAYGEVEDDAVMKITGAADKPSEKLRRYKNERLPKVAVTVDLLTTGIDVPSITDLVFIRRVRSRILYEQMMGRATRLCPDIGKEFFRIYDAVDLYAALEPYTSMKPVVTRPSIPFAQLVEELLTVADEGYKSQVIDEIVAKLQARKRRVRGEHLESFVTLAGDEPGKVLALLKAKDTAKAVAFFRAHPGLAPFLDTFKPKEGRHLLISEHADELIETQRGYGNATRPDDYLAGFKAFIQANENALDALLVVTRRPRDLTRQQLRELRLKLDEAGYPESALRTAWAQVSNQDIAASIIGFIRQQALGSPLVPYDQRVDRALQRVLASQAWTTPQRLWLERIGKQVKAEIIVDRDALDRGQFKSQGGFARLNKVFDGKLEQVLGTLHEELWRDVG